MKRGDLVEPLVPQDFQYDRFIYLSNDLPWREFIGMIGATHPFLRGTTGIYLEQKSVHPKRSGQQIFYRILTSDGKIGWLHESWVKRME